MMVMAAHIFGPARAPALSAAEIAAIYAGTPP